MSSLRLRLLGLGATVSVSLMTSFSLREASSCLLTEPLCTLFTLLAPMPLGSRRHLGSTKLALARSALLAALAAITRHRGITAILTRGLLLLARRDLPVPIRLKHAVVYGAVSSIPLAVFPAHNGMVGGTLTGYRGLRPEQPLSDSLGGTVSMFHTWVMPTTAPDRFGSLPWGMADLGTAFFIYAAKWEGTVLWRQGRYAPAYLDRCALRSSSWLCRSVCWRCSACTGWCLAASLRLCRRAYTAWQELAPASLLSRADTSLSAGLSQLPGTGQLRSVCAASAMWTWGDLQIPFPVFNREWQMQQVCLSLLAA